MLAAGLGTRLDPLTRLLAKAAVPLGRRSLIEHALAWLRDQGVREVVSNLHHRPASITTLVADGAHLGLRVRYSWERQVLGSAGGPRHAMPLFETDTFLIVNGDTICNFPLAPLLEAHARERCDVTMAVIPNPAPEHYNGLALAADGAVTGRILRGSHGKPSWHLVGVQVANASVFRTLPDDTPAETVSQLYLDMIAARPGSVRGFPVDTEFLDVGTPQDYWRAALTMAARERTAEKDVAGKDRHRDADDSPPLSRLVEGQTIVWRDATVSPDADLRDCIVAGPVRVPAGAQARRKIIVPAAQINETDDAVVEGDVGLFSF